MRLKPLLLALLLIPWLNAIPSFGAVQQPPVLSDFDADNKLDQATLYSDGFLKQIHIAFGKSSWSSLSFQSTEPERGGLFSGDVDHDGDIDLVWTAETGGESVTWLGDGRGNFSIDRNRKVDLDSFLKDSHPRVGDDANGQELQAVSLTRILILPCGFEYRPYLCCQASLRVPDPPSASAPFLTVNKQRGPPPRLS